MCFKSLKLKDRVNIAFTHMCNSSATCRNKVDRARLFYSFSKILDMNLISGSYLICDRGKEPITLLHTTINYPSNTSIFTVFVLFQIHIWHQLAPIQNTQHPSHTHFNYNSICVHSTCTKVHIKMQQQITIST